MTKFVLPLAIGALIALWVGPIIEKAMTEAAAVLVYNIDKADQVTTLSTFDSAGKLLTLPACVTEDSNNCFWDAAKANRYDVTYLID